MSRIDSYSCERAGIQTGHFLTHAGRLYQALFQQSNIGAATTTDYSIVTSATKEMHLDLHVRVNQGIQTFSLIEGPTGVTGGSAVTPWNKNRNSSATPDAVIKSGVTGTTGGTAIVLGRGLYAGEFDLSGGRPEDEIILKAGTTYVFRVVTGAGAGNHIDVDFDFYETNPKGLN